MGSLSRFSLLPQVSWQPVVDVSCCNGRVPERHTQLMQVTDDVPCRIKSVHRRALMLVNFEVAALGR